MLFPVKVRAALVGLVVAGGAAAAATLGPAGPAVGQSSPPIQVQLQVNSPATLVAKGAGVDVSVTASCSGVSSGTVAVSLTEAVGKSLASGFGSTIINCTGTTQTISVRVAAGSGKPFRNGSAQASVGIQACTPDFTSCASQGLTPIIRIVE